MTIITLPPEVEEPLAEEARRKGTTPELLAVDCLRKVFTPAPSHATLTEGETLFDFLEGYAGTISGTTEPLSEDCGRRFAEGKSEIGVEIGGRNKFPNGDFWKCNIT